MELDDEELTIEQRRLISSWEISPRDTAPEIERCRLALASQTPVGASSGWRLICLKRSGPARF